MAIDRLVAPRRMKIAWFEVDPPGLDESAFLDRDFAVARCSNRDLKRSHYLAGIAAVVFIQSPEKPLAVLRGLRRHAKRLLDHDCRIVLRPAPGGLGILTNTIAQLRLPAAGLPPEEAEKLRAYQPTGSGDIPPPHIRVLDPSVPGKDLANTIVRSLPGYAPNTNVKIAKEDRIDEDGTPRKWEFRPAEKTLIQRAFADCAEVHFVPLDRGHSGTSVFRAYPELAQGQLGRWPLPHFVKIGDRAKIFAEYVNYEDKVEPYVPFHLGPHLLRERCCLGAREGIIVGDYVEESENLTSCACEGRAATAIACLFDRTLVGWHRSSLEKPSSISAELLKFFPRRISPSRFSRAQELGATRDLPVLRAMFMGCSSAHVRVGPIHGDLHAANVRVRANDAIMIDFYASREGPLLYDAACLEASLLVEGFAKDSRDASEWLSSLEGLYTDTSLDGAPQEVNPKSRSFWFDGCIRQIRRYARQWECGKYQYAIALAVAFLVKAGKDPDAVEPEASRRAAAYLLAERLLLKAFTYYSSAANSAASAPGAATSAVGP